MNGLGDLFSMGVAPGMSPEQADYIKRQQMLGFFSNLARASAPSTDPRASSLAYALSQGISGMGQAGGEAMQKAMAAETFQAKRDERKRREANRLALESIPQNLPVSAAGPPTPEGIFPTAEGTTPRPMGDYLREYATMAMQQGDMDMAAKAAGLSQALQPKPGAPKELMYQDEKGNYRWGLFAGTEKVKDLRAATEKEVKSAPATQINIGNLKPLSGETAGKLAMLSQASKDVREVIDMVVPGGNLDVFAQTSGYLRLPTKKGREISSRIENAVAAKLRAETGAAATEAEVKNIAKRFKPVPFVDDSDATIDKLTRLDEYLKAGAEFIDPTGEYRKLARKRMGEQKPAQQDYDFEYVPGEGLR